MSTKRIPRIRVAEVHAADGALGYVGCLVVDGDRLYACGGTHHQPTLLVSDDAGRSFRRLVPPATPGLRQLRSYDGTLYVVGEYGLLAASVDSGLTWTRLHVDTSVCLFDLHRAPDGTWWIAGDEGVLLRSHDGIAYERVESGCETRLLQLTTIGGTVYVCGYDGTIRRWTGAALEPLALEAEAAITSLSETSAGTWLAIGDGGAAFRSTDRGATWDVVQLATAADLEAALEVPAGILVAGDDGTLLFSDDDARTFVEVPCDADGHLWSLARWGDVVLLGGDEGAIWAIEVSAIHTMEVELADEVADEDDDEDAADDVVDEDEDDDADARDAVEPVRFTSVDEASARWIREGRAFADDLNAYVRRCYEVGANRAGHEPSETRQDMAAYVLDQLVELNAAGEAGRARELFPPAYEPFDYESLGRPIEQLALLGDGRLLARVGGAVYHLERDRIDELPGVRMFARSPDRRFVARGYDDRVDVHDGWDGPRVCSLPALADAPESATVAPDGRALLVATERGICWLSEAGMRRLLPDEDGRVSYAHAAMSPNGRFVALGVQDSPHVVIDRQSGRRYTFEPASSYPNFAAFHHDRPEVLLSSCHALYGSATLAVDLERLVAHAADPARPLDRRVWVTAVASTREGYILGDRSGYLWAVSFAGQQQWYTFLGSTQTALDISADGRRLVAGSYGGFVVELDLTGGSPDPRLLSNGPGRDVARWLFWRGHAPMIW